MKLSERSKSELTLVLKRIREITFAEDDIKNLLINWRPHFPKESLIWELACFMAHTEARDRGVFHKELDTRYAKMIYGRTFGGDFNKTLDPKRIEKNVFSALMIGGIETTEENYLFKKTGLNKTQAIDEIKRSYTKDASYFILKHKEDYSKLESIFQVILGMMNMTASIDNEKLISEIDEGIHLTCEALEIEKISLNNKTKIDILICIVCLLHSHEFVLFDETEGQCKLDANLNSDGSFEISLLAKVFNIHWSLITIPNCSSSYFPDVNLDRFDRMDKEIGFNAVRNEENELIVSRKE